MGRNWKEINQIPNRNLRLTIAQLKLDSEREVVAGLKAGFPDCFTEGENEGAMLLSDLVELGWCLSTDEKEPDLPKACELVGISVHEYALAGDANVEADETLSAAVAGTLPLSWQEQYLPVFSDIVPIDDAEYLVIVNDIGNEFISVIRAQCIKRDTRHIERGSREPVHSRLAS